MRRNVDASASRCNGDTSISPVFSSNKRPRSNALPCTLLQKLFIGGIFMFVTGIFVTYSLLMNVEIEANSHHEGLRIGGVTVSHDRYDKHATQHKGSAHKDSGTIPGRATGSQRGQVKCDQDISHLVSYWSDPRSDDDRAFQSPFITESKSKRRRYLSFEPDCVSIFTYAKIVHQTSILHLIGRQHMLSFLKGRME